MQKTRHKTEKRRPWCRSPRSRLHWWKFQWWGWWRWWWWLLWGWWLWCSWWWRGDGCHASRLADGGKKLEDQIMRTVSYIWLKAPCTLKIQMMQTKVSGLTRRKRSSSYCPRKSRGCLPFMEKLLRQNWIYSLGYYPIQRCVFGAGSFLNKRDKFVVCAWTPPDWLPGKMRNESFCGFLNLKRGSVCISGLMHKSKCQRQCVTGKRKITFLVFTQGLFKLMLMMKSKNWGQ